MTTLRNLGLALLATTLVLVAVSSPAAAHTTKTSADGKIKFTFGWEDEPATTDIPNRVFVRIVDNATGAGIADIDKIEGLTFSLHLGDKEKEFKLAPQRGVGAGNYTSAVVITPSDPGIYELHIEGGVIQGSEIDVEITANHELEAIEDTFWPTKPEDVQALKSEVALLKAQVETLNAKVKTASETPTPVTTVSPSATNNVPMLGAVALVGVLVLVALRRKA